MRRREFTKSVLATSSSLLISPLIGCMPQTEIAALPKALPNNWVWLRPDLSWTNDQWKKRFSRLKEIGIDAVLPQVYNSHFTLFDHPILPVKERLLEKIIPLAHAVDLEVHAWMWCMPLNVPELIEKHPDWFSVNRNNKPSHTDPAYVDYYKFMCPCHPEVQNFVAGNVEALGKIEDLDGIHLDYIRQPDVILAEALQPKYDIVQDKEFPEYDYPYSENCRNLFKAESGVDPIDLGDEAPAHEAWRQFRYNAITKVVNEHCVPMAKKYNKKITAAVFTNWESVRQQWQVWDLDGFLPMLYQGFYNKDISWIGEKIQENKAKLKNGQLIYAGLFLEHLTPSELSLAYSTSIEKGATGISLFADNNLNEVFESELKKVLLK